jgi:hypothetical protein
MRVDILEIEDDVVFVYTYDQKDVDFGLFLWSTVGKYRVRKDKPHSDKGEYHIHVYEGANEILAVNKSGTAHDQSHGKRIPNRVYDYLKEKYPTWKWPMDQIIPFLLASGRTHDLRPIIYKVDTEERTGYFQGFGEFEIEKDGVTKIVTRAIVEKADGQLTVIDVDKIKFTK